MLCRVPGLAEPEEEWTVDKTAVMADGWDAVHGDRKQEVVIIGIRMNRADVEAALNSCLCTEEEMVRPFNFPSEFDKLMPSQDDDENGHDHHHHDHDGECDHDHGEDEEKGEEDALTEAVSALPAKALEAAQRAVPTAAARRCLRVFIVGLLTGYGFAWRGATL